MISEIFRKHGPRGWQLIDPERHRLGDKEATQVATLLAEVTPAQDGSLLQDLLDRAVAGHIEAMAELGHHLVALDPSAEDLALAWTSLAALNSHDRSATVMATVCVREAASLEVKGSDDRDEILRWLRRAKIWTQEAKWALWFMQAYDDFLIGVSSANDLRHEVGNAVHPRCKLFLPTTAQPGSAPAATDKPSSTQTTAPTLRVISEIGDPDGSEGRRIARTYERLTEPLALHGPKLRPETLADLLHRDFPWMTSAIDAVLDDLRLSHMGGTPWLALSPILLVGPPGTGKTRFARTLARIASVSLGTVDAGGQSDNRVLSGTARGWSTSQPAYPLLLMMRTGCANPIVLVDEIDKAVGSHNGDIRATLLAMTENETSTQWYDECLLAEADLSGVSWILTANDATQLPRPLLSRLRRIDVRPPGQQHADALLAGLERDLATELNAALSAGLELDAAIRDELRRALGRGVDVRAVKAALRRAVARRETPKSFLQ